jgi:tetratricopeptide (TPR) repeat protein
MTASEFEREIGERLARGDFPGAAATAASCRATWPSERAGWVLGSIAALCNDEKDRALGLVDEYLTLHPSDVQCLLQRAECLMLLGRRSEALTAIQNATAAELTDLVALDAAGSFLFNAGEFTQSLAIYDRIISAHPRNARMLESRAVIHRILGDFDLAERDLLAVLALSPSNPEALSGLVELRKQTVERNYIPALETALRSAPPEASAALHFALAKSYEDLGEYEKSWRHLMIGNPQQRARLAYNRENDRAFFDQIIARFPAKNEPQGERSAGQGQQPIFIVGLPRTGTTLVERIIGSHSQVHSAGELAALSAAIGKTLQRSGARLEGWGGYGAALSQLDGDSIAREYLALSYSRRGDQARFIDKHPANFFYCGLILRAFPGAHIIHLTRHPLAACHAIYKTRFNNAYPFAYDLDELADFYMGYRRLMTHWHQVLPGRILDVAYEDLVTQQEVATRRLLEFLELPFEEACLQFHLNPAPATASASAVQVRQPLYSSSLHQWQQYAEHLAPLRKRLEAGGVPVE